MDLEKIQAAFADEAFVKSLLGMETPEEVQSALEGKGISLSLEDIDALKERLAKMAAGEISPEQPAGGELDEGALEAIAGGTSNPVLTDVISPSLQLTLDLAHGKPVSSRW